MVNEIVISGFGIILTAIMGYIVWMLQEQSKERKKDAESRDKRIAEENAKRDANSKGTRLILFYMLERLYTEYNYQGFVTIQQRRTFKDIYDAYHGLGGNGLGTSMWDNIKELEIRNVEIGLTTHAKAYFEEQEKKKGAMK